MGTKGWGSGTSSTDQPRLRLRAGPPGPAALPATVGTGTQAPQEAQDKQEATPLSVGVCCHDPYGGELGLGALQRGCLPGCCWGRQCGPEAGVGGTRAGH